MRVITDTERLQLALVSVHASAQEADKAKRAAFRAEAETVWPKTRAWIETLRKQGVKEDAPPRPDLRTTVREYLQTLLAKKAAGEAA